MVVIAACSALLWGPSDVSFFTKDGLSKWTASGTAFSRTLVNGDELRRLEIENAGPDGVLSSETVNDQPQGKIVSPEFLVSRRYLSFRIGGGDMEFSTCINLLVKNKVVMSATGFRSDTLRPVTWDVGGLKGQRARIEIVDLASGDWGHVNVSRLVQTDNPEVPPLDTGRLYEESLRPQFHFTARQWTVARLNPGMRQEGWVNDLNGLIYYEGEYHLFAQRWAKCWLHAVSKDLVHWEELEPAFWEESEGSGVQSGTCVIDYENTSGLAKDKDSPAMVAFWSRFDNKSQCLSYSLDKGRTWQRYEHNPTFEKPERDPKVFWYEPGKHWVMMMYGDGKYHILTSPNLLVWKDESNPIPDCFECPDFFELPLDGDPTRKKWVLVQGNGQYSIGTFDGKKFVEESSRLACDIGPNFYATQTFHNTETGDGRRIQMAWMRGSDFPDMPFNQQLSFPCELNLRSTPEGPRLYRFPVREIGQLLGKQRLWRDKELAQNETLVLAEKGDSYRVIVDFNLSPGTSLVFNVRGHEVVLDRQTLSSGGAKGNTLTDAHHVELLIDRGSVETFVNGGELSSTRFILPKSDGVSVTAKGGSALVPNLKVFPVKSVWKPGS